MDSASNIISERFTYVTLLTTPSYLPGLVVLAHSLRKHGSKCPLFVLYLPALDEEVTAAMRLEAYNSHFIFYPVETIQPTHSKEATLVAERFSHSWNKLRVFSPVLFGYDKVCYLDADMLIRNSNIDSVFKQAKLPGPDWLAACHNCTCNFDNEEWCPSSFRPENCPLTPLKHPDALTKPTPVATKEERKRDKFKETHSLLNAGMFVFEPSAELWDRMMGAFMACDKIPHYKFADQDFLIDFFDDKWISLGWQFNAFKILPYTHPNIWRDEAAVAVHYVLDKPWKERQQKEQKVNGNGADDRKRINGEEQKKESKDGKTHSWWSDAYDDWRNERVSQRETKILEAVEKYVS